MMRYFAGIRPFGSADLFHELTGWEGDILMLIAQGLSDAEIPSGKPSAARPSATISQTSSAICRWLTVPKPSCAHVTLGCGKIVT
jgi:hypothetical protein